MVHYGAVRSFIPKPVQLYAAPFVFKEHIRGWGTKSYSINKLNKYIEKE